jgi:hypothetical protein
MNFVVVAGHERLTVNTRPASDVESVPTREGRAMMTSRLSTRLACAALLLALGACSSLEPAQSDAMSASPPFAPGWQEHTSALFNLGPGPTAGSTMWMVSGLLPRGTYEVISRQGDRARLLQGHTFEVDGAVNKEIRIILPFASGNIEALDQRYVLNQTATR